MPCIVRLIYIKVDVHVSFSISGLSDRADNRISFFFFVCAVYSMWKSLFKYSFYIYFACISKFPPFIRLQMRMMNMNTFAK